MGVILVVIICLIAGLCTLRSGGVFFLIIAALGILRLVFSSMIKDARKKRQKRNLEQLEERRKQNAAVSSASEGKTVKPNDDTPSGTEFFSPDGYRFEREIKVGTLTIPGKYPVHIYKMRKTPSENDLKAVIRFFSQFSTMPNAHIGVEATVTEKQGGTKVHSFTSWETFAVPAAGTLRKISFTCSSYQVEINMAALRMSVTLLTSTLRDDIPDLIKMLNSRMV